LSEQTPEVTVEPDATVDVNVKPTPKPERPAPTKVEDLPDWAQKQIRDARAEAAENRVGKTAAEQQQQQLLDNMAKALGLKQDDTPPDPAILQRTLSDRETRIGSLESDLQARDVELAAWRAASRQGANAVALMDSRSFVTDVGKLDPHADDFSSQLDAAVKAALESNPVLRIARGDIGQGPRTQTPVDPGPGMPRLRDAYASSNDH
jgi:soluble lytic murein transglycosylase-like protein